MMVIRWIIVFRVIALGTDEKKFGCGSDNIDRVRCFFWKCDIAVV